MSSNGSANLSRGRPAPGHAPRGRDLMPRHHDPSDTLTDAGAAGSSAHMLAFACLVGLTLAGFWASLTRLIAFSFQHEHYSHIIVVPLLGAGLVVLGRRRIFSGVQTHWRAGLGLLLEIGRASCRERVESAGVAV